MKRSFMYLFLILGMVLGALHYSEAKIVRIYDLQDQDFEDLDGKKIDELIIEFRQGDKLPLTLKAEGDLIESSSKSAVPTDFLIKRNFWIKFERDALTMSLNGDNFGPVSDSLTGNLSVGARVNKPSNRAMGLFLQFNGMTKPL